MAFSASARKLFRIAALRTLDVLRKKLVKKLREKKINMENVQLVSITHMIDPSRFYCRNLATADEDRKEIAEIERKLKEHASKNKFHFVDAADELKVGTVS